MSIAAITSISAMPPTDGIKQSKQTLIQKYAKKAFVSLGENFGKGILISFIAMPLSAIFTLIGQDFLLLLLGDQWTVAGQIFTAFAVAIGPMLLYGTHTWLHYSMG